MATPASQDVEQGAILWLPKHDEVMAKLAANGLDDAMAVMDITRWYETEDGEVFNIPKPADPKTYDHPIAVVSRPAGLSPQSPDLHRIHFVVVSLQHPKHRLEALALTVVAAHLLRRQSAHKVYPRCQCVEGLSRNRTTAVSSAPSIPRLQATHAAERGYDE